MSDTYKKESRKEWHLAGDVKPSTEHIKLGCLQRIADATELMSKRHTDLMREKEQAENSRDYWRREAERLTRSKIALRGQITKLKRRLAAHNFV